MRQSYETIRSASRPPKMVQHFNSAFSEEGTGFVCNRCGTPGEIFVEDGGSHSCGAVEASGHWESGKIVCPNCGAADPWNASS